MYPFLYPFPSADDCLNYINKNFDWKPDDFRLAEQLVAKKLIPLKTGTELCYYLGISKKLISAISLHPDRYYRAFTITKANGKLRAIHAPRVFLKTIQRYILDCILTPLPLHEAACGFRRGMSCATGAQHHLKRPFLWNIDLKDFFPSIEKKRVIQAFTEIGYSSKAAYILASLCCLDGKLPQGAPTSPALANYVFRPTDDIIDELAKAKDIVYTRYADDLSFSSLSPIAEEFRQQIQKIITGFGFRINSTKSRLVGPKCCRQVTGLTINEKISIPRVRRRQMRARFHQVLKSPGSFSHEKERLIGFAAWVFEYHPAEGKKYLEIAHSIPDK